MMPSCANVPRPRLWLAALAAPLLAGCERAPFAIFGAVENEARSLATLGWFLTGLCLFFLLLMSVLVVWAALRRRGSLEEHLPIDVGGGMTWVVGGGFILPIVVLSGLFFLTLVTLNRIPSSTEEPDLDIRVTGHQWWWQVSYLFDETQRNFETANEIHVAVGDKVRVEVVSADVIHSFWVPKLFGKLDAIPGHTNALVFQVDRPGVYWGQCAEYCGLQHAHMRFVVVAQPRVEYEQWLEQQRRPAKPPSGPLLTSGRNAFEEYACALCHRVRGTRALGGVAPDLTHVGSRLTIGAGRLSNTRARMQAWAVNAQALKPGIEMPAIDQFDGPTLNALAAYLESLE